MKWQKWFWLVVIALLATGCGAIANMLGYTATDSLDGRGPTNLLPSAQGLVESGGTTAAGVILLNLYRNWTRAKELEQRGLPKPEKKRAQKA